MPVLERLPRCPIGWPLITSVTTAANVARLRSARRWLLALSGGFIDDRLPMEWDAALQPAGAGCRSGCARRERAGSRAASAFHKRGRWRFPGPVAADSFPRRAGHVG